MEESETFEAIPDRFSKRLRTCIYECISFAPRERPTAFEILQSTAKHLKHKPKSSEVCNAPALPLTLKSALASESRASVASSILENDDIEDKAPSAYATVRYDQAQNRRNRTYFPSIQYQSVSSISSRTTTGTLARKQSSDMKICDKSDEHHEIGSKEAEEAVSFGFEDGQYK